MQRQRMMCRLLIYGLLMLLLAKPAVAQEVFTYQDLGSLNIDLTLGRYLNDAGQVSAAGQTEVYNGYDYDEVFHACISDWIDLTPGVDGDTAASQINNYGQVLVTDDWGYGGSYHLLWTPSTPNGDTGTFTDLGNVNAEDLNDYGEVVGEDSSGNAFLWKPSAPNATTGTFIHLGKGSAYSINTLGQVSCSFGLFTPSQANGATGAITAAPAGLLNDYGQILTGNQLWTPSTANGASGSAIALPFTGQALNKYGQIVGYDNQSNALLWTPCGPQRRHRDRVGSGLSALLSLRDIVCLRGRRHQ